MINKFSFDFPHFIKIVIFIIQRKQLLTFCNKFRQLVFTILKMLWRSVIMNHSFSNPFIFDLVVQETSKNSGIKCWGIFIKSNVIAIFNLSLNTLYNGNVLNFHKSFNSAEYLFYIWEKVPFSILRQQFNLRFFVLQYFFIELIKYYHYWILS